MTDPQWVESPNAVESEAKPLNLTITSKPRRPTSGATRRDNVKKPRQSRRARLIGCGKHRNAGNPSTKKTNVINKRSRPKAIKKLQRLLKLRKKQEITKTFDHTYT